MPPIIFAKKIIVFYDDIDAKDDGIHLRARAVATWLSSAASGYFEVIFQPGDSILQINTAINNAAIAFGLKVSGEVFTALQVFKPVFS